MLATTSSPSTTTPTTSTSMTTTTTTTTSASTTATPTTPSTTTAPRTNSTQFQTQAYPPTISALGPTFGVTITYSVFSTRNQDESFRFVVAEPQSGKSYWVKERSLTDKEILDSIIDSTTNLTRWTIHRPITPTNFYIRLRSPLFPPQSAGISLTACTPLDIVPNSNPNPSLRLYSSRQLHPNIQLDSPNTLTFSCRTNIDMKRGAVPPMYPNHSGKELFKPPHLNDGRSNAGSSGNGIGREGGREEESKPHSYPPTPPSYFRSPSSTPLGSPTIATLPSLRVSVDSMNSNSTGSTLVASSNSSHRASLPPQQQNQQKRFPPTRRPTSGPAPSGGRIPSTSGEITKFFISPLTHPSTPVPAPGVGGGVLGGIGITTRIKSALQSVSLATSNSFTIQTPSLPPVVTYRDTTRLLSVHTTGTLELDHGVARALGVDPSFWIAAALAYLEYLADSQSYSAASGGS